MSHYYTPFPRALEKPPMAVPKRFNSRAAIIVAGALILSLFYFFHFTDITSLSTSIKKNIASATQYSGASGSSFRIADAKDGPTGDQVLLLMASDGAPGGSIPHEHEMALENRQEYCDFHGYTCVEYDYNDFSLKEGTHTVWKKVLAVQRAFHENPSAEWVVWVDLDVIIMNAALPLSTYLLADSALERKLLRSFPNGGEFTNLYTHSAPSNSSAADINLIVANDWNGLNAGVFALRRSKWTDMVLDLWFDEVFMEKDWSGKEQDALYWLMDKHDHVWNHVGFVEQHVLNAYYSAPGAVTDLEHDKWQGHWQDGDLLVHMAGCWVNNECEAHWMSMWERRTKVPEELLKHERQFQ